MFRLSQVADYHLLLCKTTIIDSQKFVPRRRQKCFNYQREFNSDGNFPLGTPRGSQKITQRQYGIEQDQ
jgi:hypothetical protein